MTWDKTLPSNTTKIRDYPSVLTGNFAAVEEGDSSLQLWKLNCIQRNAIPAAPPVTPSRIDNTMQPYAKQNADGNTDLYVLDDRSPANDIELTENGRIGGRSQDFVMNEFYFGTDAVAYGQWAIPSVVASIDSSGNVVAGSTGIASTSPLTHGRRLTFTSGYISTAVYYLSLVPILSSSSGGYLMWYTNKQTTSVDVYFKADVGVTGNIAFDVVIFGGR